MQVLPQKLELVSPEELRIEWNDGVTMTYLVKDLRDRCPCATCREKRQEKATQTANELLTVLSPAETMPSRIEQMRPIGNYAYSIEFNDGHDTGIYTLEFLRGFDERVERNPT